MVFQSAILYSVFSDGVCFYTALALTKILYRFIAFFMIFRQLGRQNGRQNYRRILLYLSIISERPEFANYLSKLANDNANPKA